MSVLSFMCLVSGTKTHELSGLHPSPSHSCFNSVRQFLNLYGERNKILGYHKDRPCSIWVQSFVYLTNHKEGNTTQLYLKAFFSAITCCIGNHILKSELPNLFEKFLFCSINEPCKADFELLLFWTALILQNHTAFSPSLI